MQTLMVGEAAAGCALPPLSLRRWQIVGELVFCRRALMTAVQLRAATEWRSVVSSQKLNRF